MRHGLKRITLCAAKTQSSEILYHKFLQNTFREKRVRSNTISVKESKRNEAENTISLGSAGSFQERWLHIGRCPRAEFQQLFAFPD